MDVIGCRIELLGELRVVHGDHAITRFRTHKAAGLIAYLALFLRQVHPRERIADLFWPDKEPEAGRQNLTTILTSLRRQLEAAGLSAQDVLLSDRQVVRLNPACVTTDIDEFDRLLASASKERDPAYQATILEKALSLYRSEPLPDHYEEWALDLHARYTERYADALDRLCAVQEALGKPEAALDAAQRAIRADPYREAPRCVQIRAYATLGRSTAAINSYQQYERLLQDDMGATPSAVMQGLVERVRRDPKSFDRSNGEIVAPTLTSPQPDTAVAPVGPHKATSGDAATVTTRQATLPLQLTRFIGRELELASLETLLRPATEEAFHLSRLVTLTGPGGTGKTRLSLEAAGRLAPAFQGRVWFVELAHLLGPDLLPTAILNAVKRTDGGPARDVFQALEEEIGAHPCLLVLDNFEHLLHRSPYSEDADGVGADGSDYVRLLLERIAGLTCLITSRQPLHIGGEQEFPVSPLSIPDNAQTDPGSLLKNASIALYTDRAILAKPDFALTQSNAATIATLCRRLEGMPLAIEMAAAWARTLAPAKVLERMVHQLDLLVSRRRDLPPRHQSLRATIEWSYDLLTAEQQLFLTRLSVFRGGWTLEAAEAVVSEKIEESSTSTDCRPLTIGPLDVLDLLTSLVDKNLVVAEQSGEQVRYRLQEMVREFCNERLVASGERIEIQSRHRDYFLALSEASEAHAAEGGQMDLLPRLEEEHDNLRAAIHFCRTDPASVEIGFRFPVAMHHFWESRGYLAEGLRLSLALLERPRAQACTEGRGNVLQTCFWMAFYQGDYAAGRPWIEESLAILREIGNPASLGNALNAMGAMLTADKDHKGAQACFEETLVISRQLGDRRQIGRALHNLASVVRAQGDAVHARELFEQSLAMKQTSDRAGRAATLQVLSRLDYEQGDLVSARRLGEEALRINREVGNKTWEMFTLSILAWIALAEGKEEDVLSFCAAGLELEKAVGSKQYLASTLECLAELAHRQQLWERAGCLWGAASALRAASGQPDQQTNKTTYQAKVSEARSAFGEASFQKAWEAGGALTMERMILYALSTDQSPLSL